LLLLSIVTVLEFAILELCFKKNPLVESSADAGARPAKRLRRFQDFVQGSEDENASDSVNDSEGEEDLESDSGYEIEGRGEQTPGDRDYILEPDYHEYDDQDADDDLDLPHNGPSQRIPEKLTMHLDDRCGSHSFPSLFSLGAQEIRKRRAFFEDRVRRMIKYLKAMPKSFSLEVDADWQFFTMGFAALLNNASEDYLFEQFMSGIPESTVMVSFLLRDWYFEHLC
jgi:hypothetical protein